MAEPRSQPGGGDLHHPLTYFETMYSGDGDPWGFETRWYELRKYAITLAALPDRRYRRALEPGCANGALTARLAERCDELIAFDLVGGVTAQATARLVAESSVTVLQADFPQWWPEGVGDLVVWSEIVYYLTPPGFGIALEGLERWLEPGGVLIAVHYTGDTDYPMSGDEAHDRLHAVVFLDHICAHRDEQFRVDVWRRARNA